MLLRLIGPAALIASTLPNLAIASPGQGRVEESPTTLLEADPDADYDYGDRRDQPWIERWAPEPHMGEIGIYGGILMPSPEHELFEPDLSVPDQGFEQLARIAPDVGLRAGYYPSRFFGIEAEGGVMPTRLRDVNQPALLYTARGQLVFQLGLWSVTPFVLVGGGGLGVVSDRDVLGNDIDPLLHFGGGLKIYLNRYVMLRLDVRDLISHKQGVDEIFNAHNLEVLLGLSFTLGREKREPRREVAYEVAPSDRDNDGFVDASDNCPDEAETINDYLDNDGCPELDSDGDGIWDEQDNCPDEAEIINAYLDEDGCPESDRDGDGFWDEQDSCPDEAETVNGYQDQDGCPDEIPEEVQAFTGAIKGITFETGSDVIRPSSAATLDQAVTVLQTYPDVRLLILGHTDDRGERDLNLDLSKRRAEAVKVYLVERGIDASRLTTEGRGPDEPIDSNASRAGRANNRRIEFTIVR
jgi:outer membrane protein OmpA-like peptidoglycan-associated protein